MTIIETTFIYSGVLEFINCNLSLEINLKTYDTQKQYYYIDYKWIYNHIMDHPLYDDKDFINSHNDGDIVYKNELTSKMIEYLIMDHTSMDVGNSSPLIYKVQIIKSLSLLWD